VPASEPVRVVYRKYDGSLHWHMTLDRLGCDEHGTWLSAPAGTQARRGSEPPVTYRRPSVRLIPHDGQWTMICHPSGAWAEIYIDVTTTPRWIGSTCVEMIDLDLDVVRFWDGSAEILDADEFAEHQVRYQYPSALVQTAEKTTELMLDAVARRAEPFAEVCRRWLAQVPSKHRPREHGHDD
jgi:uncharacterized protein